MSVKWYSEHIVFETMREADVWAEAIANEIYGRNFNGYTTPDCKIAYALSFKLASFPNCEIHTKEDLISEPPIYEVWVTFFDDKS